MLKRFILFFLPMFFLLTAGVVIVYKSNLRHLKAITEIQEVSTVAQKKSMISREFEMIISDILFLASQHEVIEFLNKVDNYQANGFLKDLNLFSVQKKIYDQIRLLDTTGQEVARVNYKYGKSYTVPEEELQFKGNRYYFKKTMSLKANEIFISPFDLNIEHGEVEKPYNPVIRFGVPAFYPSAKKYGIVIVNYRGARIIDILKKSKENPFSRMMFLDRDGYWLVGPNPEDEWGFMFEDKKDLTFGKRYPDAWKQVSHSDSGQFYTGEGLFTFTTVYPPHEVFQIAENLETPGKRALYWKIVTHIPEEGKTIDSGKYSILYFLFIMMLGAAAWILARISLKDDTAHRNR